MLGFLLVQGTLSLLDKIGLPRCLGNRVALVAQQFNLPLLDDNLVNCVLLMCIIFPVRFLLIILLLALKLVQAMEEGQGGTPVAEKFPMANFNCSFTNIEKWEDLAELFYLLMLGSGVGFKSTIEMARNMKPIRTNVNLILSEYNPVPVDYRLENTDTRFLENGFAKIYVGDSKEGWRDALMAYFGLLTKPEYEHIHTIKVSFNSIRPKGERLKTFGGTASGPEPLREMFAGFDNILNNRIDPTLAPIEVDEKGYGQVRPIHILDMGNFIGANVVAGGVRRTAEIMLFEASDYETLFAKYGINGFWSEEHFRQHEKVKEQLLALNIPIPGWFDEVGERMYDSNVNGDKPFNWGRKNINHRRMSNNSIVFTEKPIRSFLHLVFQMIQLDGEPGFINMEEMSKRRENAQGINPCFRGDMRLLTVDGYKRFDELDGQTVELINLNGDISTGRVWCSGEKEIYEIKFMNRPSIFATKDHVFATVDGYELEARELRHQRLMPYLKEQRTHNPEHVKLGFLQGDGNLTRLDSDTHKGLEVNIGSDDEDIFNLFGVNGDGRSFYINGYNDELKKLGFSATPLPERVLPSTYPEWGHAKKAGFLSGLYSANGCVVKNGGRIAFKSTCKELVEQVKVSLKDDFDIESYITTNKVKQVAFDNGVYECRESYDLNIQQFDSRVKFYEEIGFYHLYKTETLIQTILETAPMVISVKSTGTYAPVYDFTEPKTHWGVVEGVVAHNCAEILLDNKQQCNLTTVNLAAFAKGDTFDVLGAIKAQELSARAGVRMALVDLELPEWDAIHKRDRLTGCSLTGVMDAIGSKPIDRQKTILQYLSEAANNAASDYAAKLRIARPLLVTALKPEGSLSLVAGGVSPGLHDAHSKYFIRRIRISSDDALAKAAVVHGWQIHPEVGTPENKIENARTLVIDFPVKSGATKTKDDMTALEQFERYLMFQEHYTNHNSSNTITVKPEEWDDLEAAIDEAWDRFVGGVLPRL